MAELSAQKISETGLNPTYASATEGGDTVVSDGGVFLHVKLTGDVENCTVTVTKTISSIDLDGYGDLTKSNATVTVSNSNPDGFLGPFPPFAFNSTTGDGTIAITYSSVSGITIAAFYL